MSTAYATLPGTRPEARTELWVLVLGGFAICRDGQVGTGGVTSRKARTLLALLAVHHRRVRTVDHIIDALWGNRPPNRPEAGISTLVSRLRKALGQDAVVGDRNGYRLGNSTRVDLYEAAALIADAEAWVDGGSPAAGLRSAEQGLELLDRGPVMAGVAGSAWADAARGLHAGMLRRGRHAAAEAALRTGDPGGALVFATAAIDTDPLDEVAYRALIRAYAGAGERARALETYNRLRTTLAAELGIDPSAATRDLHRALLSGSL